MPGPEFFQTSMGHRFYEYDVPRIATALEHIALALEALLERQKREDEAAQKAARKRRTSENEAFDAGVKLALDGTAEQAIVEAARGKR